MLDLSVLRLGATACLTAVLAGCTAVSRPPTYAATGAYPMVADNEFTLYTDGGFVLANLPDPALVAQFWDKFSDQLADQTNSETTASLSANGRVLRVLYVQNNVPMAYHYAIIPMAIAHSIDIRVQPIMAWSPRMGQEDEAVPMRAADAAPQLAALKTQLKSAAAAAMP